MSVSDRGAKGTTTISGITGGGNAATSAADIALGSVAGTVSNQGIIGTSGIGILKQVGARALKLELEALESLALSRTLSQPSVFTLNNQQATITQGEQIPYQTTSDGTTTTEFKEAALSLTVTPSIIGDGNVLLDIKVNNDTAVAGLADESKATAQVNTAIPLKPFLPSSPLVPFAVCNKGTLCVSTTELVPARDSTPLTNFVVKGTVELFTLIELEVVLSAELIVDHELPSELP